MTDTQEPHKQVPEAVKVLLRGFKWQEKGMIIIWGKGLMAPTV